MSLAFRADDGSVLRTDPERWSAPATSEDEILLARLVGPVLDVGCGPGRALVALGRRGVIALGVDPSPVAVTLARRAGVMALRRSVFDHLPGTGRWQTAMLLDGNVGIGGEPVPLLARLRRLLAPGGEIVAEVDPPGSGCRHLQARLERDGQATPWFPWAEVGADAIEGLAIDAGLRVGAIDRIGNRRFARLLTCP